ncbi:MAG: enolase C-terminal domain-like protein [Deinococcales bacterium]
MKIEQLEVLPYSLPLKSALAWGKHSQLSRVEHCLVRVRLEDGSTGIAEAPPRPTIYGETIGSIKAAIAWLEPRICELEITDTDSIKQVLGSLPNNNCAKGALDMALWEARAVAEHTPLEQMLGCTHTRLETSFILGIASPEEMLREAKEVVESGVRVLKVKVGRNTANDLEVIKALRLEFDDMVKLYADSNETLDAASAPHALAAMREAGLLWVEEPLPIRQIKARAELKRLGILPIIADDSCFTPADLLRELEFDTFDVLNIKSARNGFTDSFEMMRLAAQASKGIMIGSQASTTLGIRHAALLAARAEVTHPSELAFFLKLGADIATRQPKLERGFLDLADVLEVGLDLRAWAQYEGS